jgi:hypothetical protein
MEIITLLRVVVFSISAMYAVIGGTNSSDQNKIDRNKVLVGNPYETRAALNRPRCTWKNNVT